jgi:autotransporter adhesin
VWAAEQGAQADANRAQNNADGYAGQVAAADSGQALQAANAHSNNLFTLTCHRTGNGSGDIVCGRNASVSGQNASAQGREAVANGNGANAYGAHAEAIGNDATALGNAAQARGYSTTAVGDHAEALAPNSTALGEDATALGAGSVALGYGSVAHRPNSVSVGNAATGMDRQITNVAAGTQPHDAVNLGQFEAGLQGANAYANAAADKVGSVDASLSAASAEAAAGKHRNTIAGATAEYNGQTSFAFAYQHRFGTHWASMLTVGSNGGAANTTIAGAASFSW